MAAAIGPVIGCCGQLVSGLGSLLGSLCGSIPQAASCALGCGPCGGFLFTTGFGLSTLLVTWFFAASVPIAGWMVVLFFGTLSVIQICIAGCASVPDDATEDQIEKIYAQKRRCRYMILIWSVQSVCTVVCLVVVTWAAIQTATLLTFIGIDAVPPGLLIPVDPDDSGLRIPFDLDDRM
ncbi:hypothetical protein N9S81_00190 [bacterium]|nr:hypothetical protein [bacterium]